MIPLIRLGTRHLRRTAGLIWEGSAISIYTHRKELKADRKSFSLCALVLYIHLSRAAVFLRRIHTNCPVNPCTPNSFIPSFKTLSRQRLP